MKKLKKLWKRIYAHLFLLDGAQMIAKARAKEKNSPGWEPGANLEFYMGELGTIAACLATGVRIYKPVYRKGNPDSYSFVDPWPETVSTKLDIRDTAERMEQLIEAGRLIAAEIDRIILLNEIGESIANDIKANYNPIK